VKASFLVSGFNEWEDFWVGVTAGHQFNDNSLQRGQFACLWMIAMASVPEEAS
jgi:hypothetical protein